MPLAFFRLYFSWAWIILLISQNGVCDSRNSRLLYSAPQDLVVQLESKACFICKARARSPPIITWKVNGKHVTRARYVITSGVGLLNGTSTLSVNSVRQQDNNSLITCIANSGGNLSDSAAARLTVLNPSNLPVGFPSFKDQTNSVRAVEKSYTAVISCSATGDPTPDIIWTKNSLPLDVNNARYNSSVSGSLMIRNAEESDEGVYGCIARNAKGAAHSKPLNLYVKVRRVRPQFSIRPKSSYSVNAGGSLEIVCAAVGHPVPSVGWKINTATSQDGPTSENVITGVGDEAVGRKTLKLTNLTKSIRFACTAISDLGRIETVTMVNVAGSRGSDFTISENYNA